MEDLHAIIYVSKAVTPFDPHQLEELAMHSLISNQEAGITGFLYYDQGHFLQYLEGPRDRVQALMDRIKADPRHQLKDIKEKSRIQARKFPDWHMHRLHKTSLLEVRMEKLVLEYMLMMRKDLIILSKRADESIWQMVNKVARLQSTFV